MSLPRLVSVLWIWCYHKKSPILHWGQGLGAHADAGRMEFSLAVSVYRPLTTLEEDTTALWEAWSIKFYSTRGNLWMDKNEWVLSWVGKQYSCENLTHVYSLWFAITVWFSEGKQHSHKVCSEGNPCPSGLFTKLSTIILFSNSKSSFVSNIFYHRLKFVVNFICVTSCKLCATFSFLLESAWRFRSKTSNITNIGKQVIIANSSPFQLWEFANGLACLLFGHNVSSGE
jgi:hypothetical protein